MKYLNSLVFLVVISASAYGQEQKIGFIDSDYILSKMPDYQGLSQKLDVIAQAWREEADRMQQEIDELKADYQAKEILYTEAIRQEKQQEIQQMETERQTYLNSKFGPQGDYYRQQQELLLPIQQQVMDAVNRVAEQDSYDFVFDRTGDLTFFYVRPEHNLSDKVLFEMGIDVDEEGN
jgi:outer membrane protein